MTINGYWWNINETPEGVIIATSGPHSEVFDFSTSMEEIYTYLSEYY